ncbi:MAG: phage virion morphogenesis protein [Acidobacteria bacterium]|nr:phage virion morphogenesis protein [Acidobacteriota bacterium]MYI73972.1 phage virion morphogenesis protein [Acidobacteriota bacterium]
MAAITVDVDTGPLQAALRRAVDALEGDRARDMFDDIGGKLVESTLERFEREHGPDGQAWKPSQRALEEGGQTLTDKGYLRNSITHVARRDGVDVGTNVPYGAIHQFGGEIQQQARSQVLAFAARGGRFTSRAAASRRRAGTVRVAFASIGARAINMPARPYLGLDEGDRREVERIVELAIGRAIG